MLQEESLTSPTPIRSNVSLDIDYDLVTSYIAQEEFWKGTDKPQSDEYFGDIVEIVIEAAHPPDPRPAFPPGPHYLPLKLLMIGPSFSGKHTLAKGLQEKYGVRPLELKTVVSEAIRAIEKKMEPEDPKKRKQQEEPESELFLEVAEEVYRNRENVPATLKADILRARLRSVFGDEAKALEELEAPVKGKKKVDDQPKRNTHGTLLIAYPTTLEEAKELERVLSGFIHPSDLPEPLASVKLRDAKILISPSEKLPPVPEKERSFFDVVFWLDGELDNIILRSTDRRVDPSGNSWNLTFNPPPDNLLSKMKLVDDPEHTPEKLTAKYQEFDAYRVELYEWMSHFGYHQWQENALELVETDMGAKEVLQKAINKIEKVLKLKEDHPEQLSTDVQSRASLNKVFRGQTVEIPQGIAQQLNNSFEKMKSKYLFSVSSALKSLPEVKIKIDYLADAIKTEFREFLSRPDLKQDTLAPFLQALDSLISSKPYIPSNEKQELYDQIEEMSDQLWEIIYARKDEDVMERQRVIENMPYVGLYAEAMEVAKELLQAETLWFFSVLNLEKDFNSLVLHKSSGEKFQLPVLSLNLKKRAETEYGTFSGALAILTNLQNQIFDTVPKSFADLKCLSAEVELFTAKVRLIIEKVTTVLEEISRGEQETVNLLDDWIVDAVKFENQSVNDIVMTKQLGKAKEAVSIHLPLTDFQLPLGTEVQTHLRS